jgi:hypothetical protein
MILDKVFHYLSLEILFFATIVGVFVAIEVGLRVGRWSRERKKHEADSPIGTLVGAMLGLLAFILAFTFGMAGSNYDARRMAVLKESNAIGTAYLRADFIPEPERTEIRDLLREYVGVRLEGTQLGEIEVAVARSEKILDALWARVSTLADKNAGTVLTGLFVQALNEVIDIHSERLMLGMHKRIPGIIWLTLYFVIFFSMLAVGYQSGIGGTRSVLGEIMLVLTFSAIIFLIADLDNPGKGLIQTSQQTMIELREKLNVENANHLPMGVQSETEGV